MAKAKHDYSQFDNLMLQRIGAGCATASALESALVEHIKPLVTKAGEEFRVIDRRLQALRKKGAIACTRVGREAVWRITTQA